MHGGFFTVRLPECRAHRPEEGFAHRPIGSSSAKGALLGVGPGLCGEFGDHVVHSRRRRIRRGAATTLLEPYPAIGPSRALHGLPGSAPRTEVGRRGAVGPSQYPVSRVYTASIVSRRYPGGSRSVFRSQPRKVRVYPPSPKGRGKRRGYPRPGIGEGSSVQGWEVRTHRSYR
jgi:hypothetical protein